MRDTFAIALCVIAVACGSSPQDEQAKKLSDAAGNYWLFGCYQLAPNESAWNVPIRVVAGGKESIILDQNNAEER
jgi:hypothetical protein